MDYLTLKWVHVISSTVLFGTGIGSAFYLLVATLSRDDPSGWVSRAAARSDARRATTSGGSFRSGRGRGGIRRWR